jgi:hypothetical protein
MESRKGTKVLLDVELKHFCWHQDEVEASNFWTLKIKLRDLVGILKFQKLEHTAAGLKNLIVIPQCFMFVDEDTVLSKSSGSLTPHLLVPSTHPEVPWKCQSVQPLTKIPALN